MHAIHFPVRVQYQRLTRIAGHRSITTPSAKDKLVIANHLSQQNYDSDDHTLRFRIRRERPESVFRRLPTPTLLRSIILGQIFQSPYLSKPGLYLLKKIAHSRSIFFDVDKNPFVRGFILSLIYRHFCAGTDATEASKTVTEVKRMGYSGAILCYAGEIMARTDSKDDLDQVENELSDEIMVTRQIEAWRDVQLKTLNAVSEGDYVGIKYTGAGASVSHALKQGQTPPAALISALEEICITAQRQNKRIWFDAEQQIYHPTIDTWTTNLMRTYNRNGYALVLTTVQAYLKSSRTTTEEYLRLARKEGWALGIKLVRGAYIASDERSKIHDTKVKTDESYDSIARDLISKTWLGFEGSTSPKVDVFLAGHNTASIRKAAALVSKLAGRGEINERVSFGQLQGMADDIGCELLAKQEQVELENHTNRITDDDGRPLGHAMLGVPKVYKCLVWGSVKECLHYLVRRAVENRGAADRMNTGLAEMKGELWRRVFRG